MIHPFYTTQHSSPKNKDILLHTRNNIISEVLPKYHPILISPDAPQMPFETFFSSHIKSRFYALKYVLGLFSSLSLTPPHFSYVYLEVYYILHACVCS